MQLQQLASGDIRMAPVADVGVSGLSGFGWEDHADRTAGTCQHVDTVSLQVDQVI
jgi:hypothetical protein